MYLTYQKPVNNKELPVEAYENKEYLDEHHIPYYTVTVADIYELFPYTYPYIDCYIEKLFCQCTRCVKCQNEYKKSPLNIIEYIHANKRNHTTIYNIKIQEDDIKREKRSQTKKMLEGYEKKLSDDEIIQRAVEILGKRELEKLSS